MAKEPVSMVIPVRNGTNFILTSPYTLVMGSVNVSVLTVVPELNVVTLITQNPYIFSFQTAPACP